MIKIITEEVVMPDLDERRFQKNPKDCNGKKWNVDDTKQKKTIYTGGFENASLICHNLNKKYYQAEKR